MSEKNFRLAIATLLLVNYLVYQNCAPAGKGGAFNIGTTSVGPVISSIALSQQSYSTGAPMGASASVSSNDSGLICMWNILINSVSVSSVNTPLDTGACALPNGQTAPTSPGSYTVTLSVTDNENNAATASAGFTVVAASPTPTPSPSPSPTSSPSPTPVPIKYSCPVTKSNSCDSTSSCQSSCEGQYQNGSTCTYYLQNATPVTVNCTPVTVVTNIYTCSIIHSNSCDSSWQCNSSCNGQYQSGSTCTYYNQNAVPTTVNCSSIKGIANEALYACPVTRSSSCDSASACESSCMGQVGKNPTCTYYLHNAVPVTVNCTFIGNYTF